MIRAKRSFVKCGDWFTGISHLSYATACLHPCVSFNNEKNCREISEHKIAVCIGNYTVREVLMKNRTRVWRNVYNTASA